MVQWEAYAANEKIDKKEASHLWEKSSCALLEWKDGTGRKKSKIKHFMYRQL